MLARYAVLTSALALSACSSEPVQVYAQDYVSDGLPVLPGRIVVAPTRFAPEFDWSVVADSVLYPEFARRTRVEETVVLDVIVGTDGRAVSVDPLATDAPGTLAPYPLLVEASVMGLRAARYRPTPADTVRFRVGVSFRLVHPSAG